MRKQVLLVFLGFSWLTSNAQLPESMIKFRKSASMVAHIADQYQPPSMDIGDPEKYYWPKTMARFLKYGVQDSLANSYIESLSPNSPFHFTLVGMARLYYLFPEAPAMLKNNKLVLQKVFERDDSNNPWTSEGTENHISMARTSGYLFAQAAKLNFPEDFPEAEQRMQQMKSWIKEWSKRVYQVGSGEWHSSIYEIYNLMGWLNLYDFALDNEVRQMARAVLDYYAAEMSLHYSFIIPGGSEMRGAGVGNTLHNGTTYLNWFWYSPQEQFPEPYRGSQCIQLMHPITSTYSPPEVLVKLARKKDSEQGWYTGSKPTYLLDQPSFVKQFFYFDHGYTLGTGISRFGGWTGASHQIVNWKMVVENGSQAPYEISGNGTFWENYAGRTRDPWTQYFQHKNVVLQLTKVPPQAEKLYQEVEDLALEWNRRWQQDFLKRFPGEPGKQVYHKPDQVRLVNESFLTFPSAVTIEEHHSYWVVKIDNLQLLILPVNGKKNKLQEQDQRKLLLDMAPKGKLCGFVMEVFKNEQELQEFLASNQVRLTVDQSSVSYKTSSGIEISMDYEEAGYFREALFDWGYGTTERSTRMTSPPFRQPDWPQGIGYGKLPTIFVDQQQIALEGHWPVFEGPDLNLNNGILSISDKELLYEVNFSDSLPVFSEKIFSK